MTTTAEAAGIHCLTLPAQFAEGSTVNSYLVEGSPLTLIDTAPNTATAYVELERRLAEKSYRLEDLERIVATHHHLDHTGLMKLVAGRSGAEVVAWRESVSALADIDRESRADGEFMRRLLLRHGVDAAVVAAISSNAAARALSASVDVTSPVDDGDVLAGTTTSLEVLYRPGHSASDIVLYDAGSRSLFTGDHLLAETSSNALVVRGLGVAVDSPRPKPLLDFRESLRKTRELDVDVAFGGHGPPIEDPKALIDTRFAEHDERAAHLLELLRPRPTTAHSLAEALFGQIAFQQVFLTVSEVLGHLDLLIADGLVVEQEGGETTLFEVL
jgi:glyoxylase-like metal-dependent hydrolase (beta-lactamase superfamily II)